MWISQGRRGLKGFNCRTNRLMTQREMVVRGFLSCQVCHQEPYGPLMGTAIYITCNYLSLVEVIALRKVHFTSRGEKNRLFFIFVKYNYSFFFFKKNIIYYFTQTDDINVFLFISNVSKFVSGTELAALNCNINSGYFIMYMST